MRRIVLLLLLLILNGMIVHGQKVAVVLSGGGAKGVTHIGVLKALEEQGIPIDYIAGTSMGAIIGGLYASGYSPDEMTGIINSKEFSRWVSGKLDPQYTYFFRKTQPDPSWLSFRFKYDSLLQTQLPTNIVSPVRMDFAFLELFSEASAASGYNFDQLMIPFRCVASDVRNNRPYVLKKGDVGTAIRASMTFPFYFKPIRIDGHLLFDGGMYNNFPSDVVIEDFFPDIIIGSKAAANYSPPDENDVISQLTSMLMGETKFNLYCDASVLIEPTLKDVNVIDFSNTAAFIDSGYVAALRMVPSIRQFVLETVTQKQHDSIRAAFNSIKPKLKINSVQVRGLQQGQALYVANAIVGQVNSRKSNTYFSSDLSIEEVRNGYFKVLGENRLKSAFPSLHYDTLSQRYQFIMDAVYEKDIVAEFGGSLSSGGSNQVFLQLNYNYWQKTASAVRLNASFGRFYNSFLMGGKMEFPGRNPKFLEVEYTFNQFNYYRTNSFFFMDDSPSYLYENNNYLRIDGGFPISYKGKVELGITIGKNRADYFHINNATQEDKADQTKFNFYSPYFEIEINTFNRKQYSNQGKRFYSALHFISGTEKHLPGTTSVQSGNYIDYHNYFAFNIDFDQYYRPGKIYVPGLHVSMYGNTLNQFRNYTSTTLFMKPYQPLYEMSTTYQAEFRPAGYIALGMRNIFTITRNIDIRTDAFLMAPFRELSSNNQQQVKFSEIFPALHKVLSASFVYNTPIGPLSASLSYFDDDLPLSFFVNLGYIIFNRSAF